MEPKIVPNITVSVDDPHLSATLEFSVIYDGDLYANAEITVLQRGMVTRATYKEYTDATGRATITVRANELGIQELDSTTIKDIYSYTKQTNNVAVGILWILAAILVVGTITLSLLYFRKWRKHRRNLNLQQGQPYKQNTSTSP